MRRGAEAKVRPPGGYEDDHWQLRDGAWVGCPRRALPFGELELGWTCDHRFMRYCCERRCGHLVCRCGLAWDEGAER